MKILIFALLVSSSLYAQSDQEKLEDKVSVKKEKGRFGKSIIIDSEVYGTKFAPYQKALDKNIQIGYFLSKDDLVYLGYHSYEDKYDSEFSLEDESQTVFEVGYRRFVKRSIYLGTYLYHSQYKQIEKDYGLFPGDPTLTYAYEKQNIGIGLSAGNQWNWEFINFGVRWIGVNINIADFGEEGSYLSPHDLIDQDISYTFLELRVGLTF